MNREKAGRVEQKRKAQVDKKAFIGMDKKAQVDKKDARAHKHRQSKRTKKYRITLKVQMHLYLVQVQKNFYKKSTVKPVLSTCFKRILNAIHEIPFWDFMNNPFSV